LVFEKLVVVSVQDQRRSHDPLGDIAIVYRSNARESSAIADAREEPPQRATMERPGLSMSVLSQPEKTFGVAVRALIAAAFGQGGALARIRRSLGG
jgi:hypothetical protein